MQNLRWSIFLVVAAFAATCVAEDASGDSRSLITELKSVDSGNQMLSKSADIAQGAIDSARGIVSGDMKNEFESACQRRLADVLKLDRDCITEEYKAAMISKRLLELSEQVYFFEKNGAPTDENRTVFQKQVATFLLAIESPKGVAKEIADISMGPAEVMLQAYQWNVFRPGYGQPFDANELSDVTAVVDSLVAEAQLLSREVGNGNLPPQQLREAAAIGLEGSKKLSKLFANRSDAGTLGKLQGLLSNWYSEHADLEKSIMTAMAGAEQLEIAAMDKLSDQNASDMLRKNDPAAIEAKRKAASAARADAQLASQAPQGRRFNPRVIAIFFAVAICGLLMWRRQNSK